MSEKIYDIPSEWKTRAFIDEAKYAEMYARSIRDPNGFWAEAAKRIHWYKAPTRVKNSTFGPGEVSIKWFEDGVTNAAYTCIDRHLAKRARQTAIQTRMESAQNRVRMREMYSGSKTEEAFSRFDVLERRADMAEGQADAMGLGAPKSLDEEIAELRASDQVDAELEALKAAMARRANGAPGEDKGRDNGPDLGKEG